MPGQLTLNIYSSAYSLPYGEEEPEHPTVIKVDAIPANVC